MAKWFPDLERSAPGLYDLLESMQPYRNLDNAWLGEFNRLNNENKHEQLVEQTRSETKQVRVAGQFGEVSWKPDAVRFGPGVFIGGFPVDRATQMPGPSATQTVQVITWVDFRFAGIDKSALQLLREAVAGVDGIETTIRPYL